MMDMIGYISIVHLPEEALLNIGLFLLPAACAPTRTLGPLCP